MKKKIIPFLLGLSIGIILSGTCVYAATLYEATEVAYDNSSSGSSSVNVQQALDDLYANMSKPAIYTFSDGTSFDWSKVQYGSIDMSSNIIPIVVSFTNLQVVGTMTQWEHFVTLVAGSTELIKVHAGSWRAATPATVKAQNTSIFVPARFSSFNDLSSVTSIKVSGESSTWNPTFSSSGLKVTAWIEK